MKMGLKRTPPVGNVRRVASIGHNTRGVMTNKVGRIVQFESFMERSLLLVLDRDQTVRDYASQPETFRDTLCVYTPDFIVWRCDGKTEIHEVTLEQRRQLDHAHVRERQATQICQTRAWSYVVHTESVLPRGAELANLLGLFRYRPTMYNHPVIVQSILRILQHEGRVLMQALVPDLASQLQLPDGMVSATVYHLLWHNHLAADFQQLVFNDRPLASPTWLWMGTQRVLS
jgi:hypothetical protein